MKRSKRSEKGCKKFLKNGKSAGIDQVNAEIIKYAPESTHKELAKLYNQIAKTGDIPSELITGLLAPLPKPFKTPGPPENLRPIILLSTVRKILTIIMLERIWIKIKPYIPKEQAAYQAGRGTTEQLLSVKILCEKAITTSDFNIYLQLIDMSKAFDTINRKLLFKNLETILGDDEMHILSILTNRPKIGIKLEQQIGEFFESYQGSMQGDLLFRDGSFAT